MCLIASPISFGCLKPSPGKSFLFANDCAESHATESQKSATAAKVTNSTLRVLHQGKHCHQVKEVILSSHLRHIWVLGLDLASPAQDSCRHTRTSLAQGHKAHEGTGASLVRGEAERGRTVQPGGKKVQGHLIHTYKHLMGQKEPKGTTLSSEVPADRGRVNGHKLKTRKFYPDTRKHLLG